jgi:hypothetical protein
MAAPLGRSRHSIAGLLAPVGGFGQDRRVVITDDVRELASVLPRAYEVLVRNRVKFRVGQIVFLALSPDESVLGFGYPKEEREALVRSDPAKFLLPGQSDMRYNWVCVRLAAIDRDELHELILDSWRMCVPKKVWNAYAADPGR